MATMICSSSVRILGGSALAGAVSFDFDENGKTMVGRYSRIWLTRWKEDLFRCYVFVLLTYTFLHFHIDDDQVILNNNKLFSFINRKSLVTHWLLLGGQKKREKRKFGCNEWEKERERVVNARRRALTCRCLPVNWWWSKKRKHGELRVFFYEQCRKKRNA